MDKKANESSYKPHHHHSPRSPHLSSHIVPNSMSEHQKEQDHTNLLYILWLSDDPSEFYEYLTKNSSNINVNRVFPIHATFLTMLIKNRSYKYRLECIKLLLNHPSLNVNQSEHHKPALYELLYHYEEESDYSILKHLLYHKADPNQLVDELPTFWVPFIYHPTTNYRLLNTLMSVSSLNTKESFHNQTLLGYLLSMMKFHPSIQDELIIRMNILLDRLIESKENINVPSKNGITPLLSLLSLRYDVLPLLKRFEQGGVNINQPICYTDGQVVYPVIKAAERLHVDGNDDILPYMIESGAELSVKTSNRDTILHLMCKVKHAPISLYGKIIEEMAKHHIDINTRNDDDQTPLHIAMSNHVSISVIKLLLEKGANPNLYAVGHAKPIHLFLKAIIEDESFDEHNLEYASNVINELVKYNLNIDYQIKKELIQVFGKTYAEQVMAVSESTKS